MLKVNFLQFKITLKFSFADWLPPLFSIVAYLYPIIFDVAVPTVLAWQVGETFDGFFAAGIEINPMRELGNGD